MSFLILGFFTGLSLILAIGAQNIFVIEQGLKKKHIFCQKSSKTIFPGVVFYARFGFNIRFAQK